jgi:hypothetical protein
VNPVSYSSLPPSGKPNGCLRVVGAILGLVVLSIAGCVAYFALQPKNVAYEDVLTLENAKTFAAHHAWSDSWPEDGNTAAAEAAITDLGGKAYGRKFGDLMDWEKHRREVASEAAEHAKDTVQTKDSTGCDTTMVTFSRDGHAVKCKGTHKEEQQDRQRQVKRDFAALFKVGNADDAVVEVMNTPSSDPSDLYTAFDTCSRQASQLMLTLPSSLPEYMPAHSDSSASDDAPNMVALAIRHSCDVGKTYANDESPQNLAAYKQASNEALLSLTVDYELYLGAYLDAGGTKEDFRRAFASSETSNTEETAGASQQASTAQQAYPDLGVGAQNAVTSFYSAISAKDYTAAYNLLDPQYRAATPFDQFVAGYQTTQEVTAKAGAWNNATHAVATDIEATDLKKGALVHARFSGYWHVKRDGADWRLYDGEMHLIGTPTTETTTAPAIRSVSASLDVQNSTKSARFSSLACGAVSDSKTGLTWLLDSNGNITWDAAVAWADSADACGRKWRLPTIEELATLYDAQLSAGTGYYTGGVHYPAHISPLFSAIGDGSWGWSVEALHADTARAFNFNQGVATQYAKSNDIYTTRAFAIAAEP